MSATTTTSIAIDGHTVLVKTLVAHAEQHRRHVVTDGSRQCQTCTPTSLCPQCLRVALAGLLLCRQDRKRGLARRLTGVELVDQVPTTDLDSARVAVNDFLLAHPLSI